MNSITSMGYLSIWYTFLHNAVVTDPGSTEKMAVKNGDRYMLTAVLSDGCCRGCCGFSMTVAIL